MKRLFVLLLAMAMLVGCGAPDAGKDTEPANASTKTEVSAG